MNVAYKAIGVHTKVRRLAYCSALVQLIGKGENNEDEVCNLLMDWSRNNEDLLNNYYNQKGAVTSKKSSAVRYMQFAHESALLDKIMGSYMISRMGLILSMLINEYDKDKTNPFFLSNVEKIFYTSHLLSVDADLLLTVFDIVQNFEEFVLKKLQHAFKKAYVSRLSYKLNTASNESIKHLLWERITIAQNEWKKPERYAEHIVPPRLGWLLDLGMLDHTAFKKGTYKLSDIGRHFANILPINLKKNSYSDITDQWLKEKFFSQVCSLFIEQIPFTKWKDVDDTELRKKIGIYLEAAFQHFRMTGAEAIPLEESILYICIRLAVESKIVMNQTDLEYWLNDTREIFGMRYEIRRLPRINESYIILLQKNN